jgi:HPt (histidine-containing phosphotransfer) domain-containing protein
MQQRQFQHPTQPDTIPGLIDHGTLDQIRFLMRTRFGMIVDKYLQSAPVYILGIADGIERQDARLIAENAHPLKSSSIALGALAVAELATQIERLARSMPRHLDDLKTLFEATAKEMRLKSR